MHEHLGAIHLRALCVRRDDVSGRGHGGVGSGAAIRGEGAGGGDGSAHQEGEGLLCGDPEYPGVCGVFVGRAVERRSPGGAVRAVCTPEEGGLRGRQPLKFSNEPRR